MSIEQQVLGMLPAKWRGDFIRFMETGFGTQEFCTYFDSDADAQQAAEMVLQRDVDEFRRLATRTTLPLCADGFDHSR